MPMPRADKPLPPSKPMHLLLAPPSPTRVELLRSRSSSTSPRAAKSLTPLEDVANGHQLPSINGRRESSPALVEQMTVSGSCGSPSVSTLRQHFDSYGGGDGRESTTNRQTPPTRAMPTNKAFYSADEILQVEKSYNETLGLIADFKEHAFHTAPKADIDKVVQDKITAMRDFSASLIDKLEPAIADARINGGRPRIAMIFVQWGAFLKLHDAYVQGLQLFDLTALRRKYPDFNERIVSFEAQPRLQARRLIDLLRAPCQQITRYPLLMRTYLKYLRREHMTIEAEAATRALVVLEDVASGMNKLLLQQDANSRLYEIQCSLSNDSTLIKPQRTLIKDGVLKKHSRKRLQLRQILLCNDALIMLEEVKSKFGQLEFKYELSIRQLAVTCGGESDDVFDNYFDRDVDFGIRSPNKSFVLRASNADEQQKWVAKIRSAIDAAFSNGDGSAGHAGVMFAPFWIPDERSPRCMLCNKKFNALFRRHHCRICGRICCNGCAPERKAREGAVTLAAPGDSDGATSASGIDSSGDKKVRVCATCYPTWTSSVADIASRASIVSNDVAPDSIKECDSSRPDSMLDDPAPPGKS